MEVRNRWREASCLPLALRRCLQRDRSALGCHLWNLQRTKRGVSSAVESARLVKPTLMTQIVETESTHD